MKSKFQTVVEVPNFMWETGYRKHNLFMGSCFTENIGGKMEILKYPVDINPFGILYNPLSVALGLRFLLERKKFTKSDLIVHGGLWHSFYHHSRFSSPDHIKTLEKINNRISFSADFLQNAEFLFLTFGTSRVYEYKSTGQIVSNCHKIPEKEFKRYRLEPGQIIEEYQQLLPEIWAQNPRLKVIFTVSPIRHWRDGAIENQRSKASLILAVDGIVNNLGAKLCAYFPSYEIIMDELRDYRFYSEDMIHLSESAINHIWDIFQYCMIDDESNRISAEIKKIVDSVNHKPFNKYTKEYLNFLKNRQKALVVFQQKFPYINVTEEEKYFFSQIIEIEEVIK
jgi:hypothetical protein